MVAIEAQCEVFVERHDATRSSRLKRDRRFVVVANRAWKPLKNSRRRRSVELFAEFETGRRVHGESAFRQRNDPASNACFIGEQETVSVANLSGCPGRSAQTA